MLFNNLGFLLIGGMSSCILQSKVNTAVICKLSGGVGKKCLHFGAEEGHEE